jgi:hypothetical protein
MFTKIDADHNGSLNRSEFVVAISMLLKGKKQQPTTQVMDLIWKSISPGETGKLDSETFASWLGFANNHDLW